MSSGSKKKEPSTKLEEPCSFNKVPSGPPYLVSYYLLGPKARNPVLFVSVRPKPHSDLKPE
jgi:hypothetical protein